MRQDNSTESPKRSEACFIRIEGDGWCAFHSLALALIVLLKTQPNVFYEDVFASEWESCFLPLLENRYPNQQFTSVLEVVDYLIVEKKSLFQEITPLFFPFFIKILLSQDDGSDLAHPNNRHVLKTAWQSIEQEKKVAQRHWKSFEKYQKLPGFLGSSEYYSENAIGALSSYIIKPQYVIKNISPHTTPRSVLNHCLENPENTKDPLPLAAIYWSRAHFSLYLPWENAQWVEQAFFQRSHPKPIFESAQKSFSQSSSESSQKPLSFLDIFIKFVLFIYSFVEKLIEWFCPTAFSHQKRQNDDQLSKKVPKESSVSPNAQTHLNQTTTDLLLVDETEQAQKIVEEERPDPTHCNIC